MAHFAQLDENNVVIQVIVVHNNDLLDNGVESESKGIAFCQSLFGENTRWIQTSYNGNFRKRYAGIGYTYHSDIDAFVSPKPFEYSSWILNNETGEWIPPVARPTDTVYRWDEPSVSWIAVPQPFPSWVAAGNPLKWIAPIPYPDNIDGIRWDEATQSWIEG